MEAFVILFNNNKTCMCK